MDSEGATFDSPVKGRSPRRWARFSLRSLLLVMTILCMPLGRQAHLAHEQRAVLAFLRRVPVGAINFDRRAGELAVPDWLRESVGDDFFQSVVEVHLTDGVNSKNLPGIVDQLARLPRLRNVYLWHAQVTDDDLRHLAPLTQITKLGLHFPHESVTGLGLRHVVHLQNIRELWLSGTSMSNDALDFVPKFRQLETLELGLFGVDDDGFRRVAECARLKSLSLRACRCSNVGLKTIASIRSLERIDFWNMNVRQPFHMHPSDDMHSSDEPAWSIDPIRSQSMADVVEGFDDQVRRFELLENWFRQSGRNLEVNSGYHDA